MQIWFMTLWDKLHTSLWFLPALMTLSAILLSFGIVTIDEAVKEKVLIVLGWVWAGGPEGARAVLSTVASSMIGLAGVTFSITLVALSLTSSQFGPRLLRNFMRDTGNQVVLGTFIATFMYCLLVLRTVRGEEGSVFVPHLSITVGLLLAVASLGVLIYFIHHVSRSIQAPQVIAVVAEELDSAIKRLFPERLGHSHPKQPRITEGLSAYLSENGCSIPARCSGYLQAVDLDELMHVVTSNDLLLRLQYRPGQFIVQGTPLMRALPTTKVNLDVINALIARRVGSSNQIDSNPSSRSTAANKLIA